MNEADYKRFCAISLDLYNRRHEGTLTREYFAERSLEALELCPPDTELIEAIISQATDPSWLTDIGFSLTV